MKLQHSKAGKNPQADGVAEVAHCSARSKSHKHNGGSIARIVHTEIIKVSIARIVHTEIIKVSIARIVHTEIIKVSIAH